MVDPFATPTLTNKRIKALFYGGPGAGKTSLALQFPRPALIDMEGSADWYAQRFEYKVMRTKSLRDVEKALAFIEQDAGKTYDTLVIDPITVLWQVIVDGYSRGADRMKFNQWGPIKAKIKEIYNRLLNMPVHVVIVCREKDEYHVTPSGEPSKVGTKPDAEKGMPYIFDVILHLENDNGTRRATVEKDRTGTLGNTIENLTFEPFRAILEMADNGVQFHDDSEVDAVDDLEQQAVQEARQAQVNGNGHSKPAASHPIATLEQIDEFTSLAREYYGADKADTEIARLVGTFNEVRAARLNQRQITRLIDGLRDKIAEAMPPAQPRGMTTPADTPPEPVSEEAD